MKRSLILILTALIIGTAVQAQIVSGKEVHARQSLTLNGNKVTGISNDTSRAQRRPTHLVTELAMKNYADSGKFPFKLGYLLVPIGDTGVAVDSAELAGLLGGGGGTPTLLQVTTAGDTTTKPIAFKVNGKRVIDIRPAQGTNEPSITLQNHTGGDSAYFKPTSITWYSGLGYAKALLSIPSYTSRTSDVILPITRTSGDPYDPKPLVVKVDGQYADSSGSINTGAGRWTGTSAIRNTDTAGSLSINTALSEAALHVKGGIICDSNRIGNDWFYTKKVTLTPAQIYTLNSSPVEVAIGESGYAYQFINGLVSYEYVSAVYEYDITLLISIDNSATELANASISTNNVFNQYKYLVNTNPTDFIDGGGIVISSNEDNSLGDGIITIKITYQKVKL